MAEELKVIGAEKKEESKTIDQIPDAELQGTFDARFDERGMFIAFMHESRGARELLGFLDQCQDIVKQHYIKKAMEEAQKKGLLRPQTVPPKDHGFLRGFRKWRH